MWAEHDVFGPPLHSGHHLQPQYLPRLLVLAHLLPPRGELCTVVWGSGFVAARRHNNVITCAFLTQQTCSNEMKCICDPDYTGKDCSVFDPIPIPTPSEGLEKYRGKHTHTHTQPIGANTRVRIWELQSGLLSIIKLDN